MAFYTYQEQKGLMEKFRLPGTEFKPKDLKYAFDRWWMIFRKKILTVDTSFNRKTIFEIKGTPSTSNELKTISFSENSVIALTTSGNLFLSDETNRFATWKKLTVNERSNGSLKASDGQYFDLAHGQGTWLAIAKDQSTSPHALFLERSRDEIHWTRYPIESIHPKQGSNYRISYGNGWWVIAGGGAGYSIGSKVEFLISKDAEHWNSTHSFDSPYAPLDLLYSNSQWIAPFREGDTLRSGPDIWMNLHFDKGIKVPTLHIQGLPNRHLNLQNSTDLMNWDSWQSIKTGPEPTQLNIPAHWRHNPFFIRTKSSTE